MRLPSLHGAGSGHEQHKPDKIEGENDPEYMRQVQLGVATSTFSAMLIIGIFCTCAYLVCCKRQRRVRGTTWGTPSSGNAYVISDNLNVLNNDQTAWYKDQYQQTVYGFENYNDKQKYYGQFDKENVHAPGPVDVDLPTHDLQPPPYNPEFRTGAINR